MPQTAMNAPATLCRRLGDVAHPDPHDREIIVATGPCFVIAAGYMAFDPAQRDAFRITTIHGDVMPDEIEQAMRDWKGAC